MTNEDAARMIAKLKQSLAEYCGLNKNGIRAFDLAISALEQPEQPEIVRCKDCKHWEYDVIFANGWCRGKQQGNPEWFCADAERKNNV